MKTQRSREIAKVTPIKSPRVLVEEFFNAPRMQDKHDALGGLIKTVVDACVSLNEIAAYGLSSPSVEKALKRKGLGYASLVQIRRAVELIAKPIEEESQRQLAASPFKSTAVGDRIKEDAIYYIVVQGVSLLENIRTKAARVSDFVAADALLKPELKTIYALPNIESIDAAKSWAKVIGKLTWEGSYWNQPEDLAPGGKLYVAVFDQALRNGRGKKTQTFKIRYGVLPTAFLKLSDAKKMEIRDKSERSVGEPLDELKATQVTQRAVEILNRTTPTEAELKSALNEAIIGRLKTVLRK